MKTQFARLFRDLKQLALQRPKALPYVGALFVCLIVYAFSRSQDVSVQIYKTEGAPSFKDSQVLGSQDGAIYEGKDKLREKTLRELLEAQASLRESNQKLQAELDTFEKQKSSFPSPVPSINSASKQGSQAQLAQTPDQIRVSQSGETLLASRLGGQVQRRAEGSSDFGFSGRTTRLSRGTDIISFPVKEVTHDQTESVVLPAGSYVKAKLMTGVEAPEGKTYPVLLQLDYAYVVANQHKLDLSGCFMIAKSQGDLSTERVQMQATKLSCVSKDGKMFEREVNGFIADDQDNSFAVLASVNSKQDRVAAMAFLSSVVAGIGSAIQQSQTTQQVTPLGGSQSVLTGNQTEAIAAGGAASAASQVTQWYLAQANNLKPTLNVGSGRDVFIVMQDSVKLPNSYFHSTLKGGTHESVYTYLSGVLD